MERFFSFSSLPYRHTILVNRLRFTLTKERIRASLSWPEIWEKRKKISVKHSIEIIKPYNSRIIVKVKLCAWRDALSSFCYWVTFLPRILKCLIIINRPGGILGPNILRFLVVFLVLVIKMLRKYVQRETATSFGTTFELHCARPSLLWTLGITVSWERENNEPLIKL
jgi:hypothetical protein